MSGREKMRRTGDTVSETKLIKYKDILTSFLGILSQCMTKHFRNLNS